MLTDVFLYLDRLLNKQLFCKATKDEPREVQAGKEGVKAKKCIGALRTLWRSSTKSHDPRVAELKQMMTASPTRARRPAPDAPAEDPAHDSGDEADHGHPDPDAADNALMDDSSSSAAEEVEEAGDASQGSGGGKGGEPSESYDSNSESENDEGEGDDCVADAQKEPVKDDSDSNAETLILGQGQSSPESVAATDGSSDSDSDHRDSQDLEESLEPGDAKLKSFIPPYARYCRRTMESFGEGTYARKVPKILRTSSEMRVKKPKQGRLDADAKRLPTFGVYDLQALGVPQEAWPIEGKEYKGQKGYTVVSDSGAALWMTALKLLYTCFYPVHLELWAIEVLLSQSAFVVKRFGTIGKKEARLDTLKTGQVSWSKFGGPGPAWEQAKAKANF
ncbi:unnamed protein product [Durusdinium trenchii]|uniref:Uncharacterized protein n=1 Tax=Durusdinium trenchii TaxID=1381693 RepID=A0ABP0JPN8_9DINO